MENKIIVESSFSSVINAPIEKIDIPTWAFNITEEEYQNCSLAHVAAGFTTTKDGRRMSINVEVLGGSPMVQHYIETLGEKDHLILQSVSDVFTPSGRTKINVTWELYVKSIDENRCEFTNHVVSSTTKEFLEFLGSQGIPFEMFQAGRQPISVAHNKEETPLFAKSIERAALKNN